MTLALVLVVAGIFTYRRLGRFLDNLSTRGVMLAIGAALIPLFAGAGAAATVLIGLAAYALTP